MKWIVSFIGIELNAVSNKEKLASALGGALSISLLVWLTRQAVGPDSAIFIIASMGASAVLLFAVPHGQLSQPWPVLAGHCFSATIGVFCSHYLGHGWLAAGCAVGLSIGVMHQLKCIHPPGGATALTAVIGGNAVYELRFQFVWWPVMTNALILLAIAIVFNWPFAWRRYPSGLSKSRRPMKPDPFGREKVHESIVKALRTLDSFMDVNETDLMALVRIIDREQEAKNIQKARHQSHHQ